MCKLRRHCSAQEVQGANSWALNLSYSLSTRQHINAVTVHTQRTGVFNRERDRCSTLTHCLRCLQVVNTIAAGLSLPQSDELVILRIYHHDKLISQCVCVFVLFISSRQIDITVKTLISTTQIRVPFSRNCVCATLSYGPGAWTALLF